jgi:hypothetical protein
MTNVARDKKDLDKCRGLCDAERYTRFSFRPDSRLLSRLSSFQFHAPAINMGIDESSQTNYLNLEITRDYRVCSKQ